jgi:2,3-bisphosphoglycerate-independent phosphoglycerate mutase
MKYALIIPDGCADEPQASLGGVTPLQAARTPHMDRLARLGLVGRADNTPPALPSGSDVATMSLFGYNPLQFHTGRAPLEAAAQGIPLGPHDWAVRCNLVTIHDGIMVSFTAEQISNAMGRRLIGLMQDACGNSQWEFYPGVSYRNLLIYRGQPGTPAPFGPDTRTIPPHDLTDGPIADALPRGPGSDLLRDFMDRSVDIFSHRDLIDSAATGIWLWGQGQAPALQDFHSRFGVNGAMITAVDLLRGLARLLGWRVIDVPGATGYLDTDYAAKGAHAVRALDDVDLVIVHVEATDEASHEGHAAEKVAALERIDEAIVGPVFEKLQQCGEYRLLVSPDHPTFLRTKTHSYGFVPFVLCGQGIAPDASTTYDEAAAAKSAWAFPHGWDLMPQFLNGTWAK